MVLVSIILPHLSTALEPSPQEQEGGTVCLKWSSTTFVIELKEPNDVDPFSSHFLSHVITLSLSPLPGSRPGYINENLSKADTM